MSFKDVMQNDFETAFLNTDEFAETVIYKPFQGRPRSIAAIVDREPPTDALPADLAELPLITIEASTSQTNGIPPEFVQEMKDVIEVADREGGPLVARPLKKILQSDPGAIKVALVR